MVNGFLTRLTLMGVIVASSALYAQDTPPKETHYNKLYQPVSVIQRASYDNFKNIKLIHTAIINFGGGEAEFNKLVDEYAEASALYFREKVVESANLFTKNEKEIQKVAMKLAKIYKNDAEALHALVVKKNVRNNINNDLAGKSPNPTADALVKSASFVLKRANDYLTRSRPIAAILYFRKAKSACLRFYEVTDQKIPDQYKKDVVDNQNKIYVSKEKGQ